MIDIRGYYAYIKPGIVYGNMWHVAGGVLLAASVSWSAVAALGVLVGTGCVIASACVVNNIIDRRYDRKMTRTKYRPSVTRGVPLQYALVYALCLAIAGFGILLLTTNLLTVALGVVAYLMYGLVYTYSKRFTVYSTIIGTIPGALPAVAGYTALTGQLDLTAVLIALVIGCWQLPHFYAISVFRRKEYASANLPILSTRVSSRFMRHIIVYSLMLFVITVVLFAATSLTVAAGIIYSVLALWWFATSYLNRRDEIIHWSRQVFFRSMIVSLGFVGVAAVDLVSRIGM